MGAEDTGTIYSSYVKNSNLYGIMLHTEVWHNKLELWSQTEGSFIIKQK